MNPYAIQTDHLRKEFKGKTAVADLSIQVKRGEVFGFLGPNGAGKTTSVKMLLGLISATAGSAQVLGSPVGDQKTRARIGFLPEHFRFHEWLTASEFLSLHGRLFQMPDEHLQQKVPELLNLVKLETDADKKLGAFSKGMLQRIGLAQAFLNTPDLVILDEPTSGLDPGGRRMVRDIICDLRDRGTTVFLNSHFLSEVEITCDRVAFIKGGRIIHTSRLDALVEGEISVNIRANNLKEDTLNALALLGKELRVDGTQLTLIIENETLLPVVNRMLVESGADVYAFTPQKLSLEELFLQVMGETN